MKFTFALFVCLSAALLPGADKKPSKPAASAAAADQTPPSGVPAKAVLVEPGTWKDTDAKGKVWLYKVSPFGVSKVAEKPEPGSSTGNMYTGTVSASEKPSNVVATIDGDTIRFQQPTPFGTKKWTRNVNDNMENDERAAIERARQSSSSKTSAK